jgi:hypothetical protein
MGRDAREIAMSDAKIDPATKKALPRWLVIVVIMATAGITAAALSATGLRGPAMAWDRANKGVAGVWSGEAARSPMDDPQRLTTQAATLPAAQTNMAPPVVAPAMASPAPAPAVAAPIVGQPVALAGAPVIVWGTPIGHGDRGPCTNCHSVVFPQGTAMPTINSQSSMPHEFRGVCNNCHLITRRGLALVAGMAMGPGVPNAAKPITEAEWRGLEVGPSPVGVMVNGADGAAKRAGMKVGDVITSINAVATNSVADFVRATENGALMQGAVIARRDGQRLAFELGPRNAPEPRNPPEPRNAPEQPMQPMQPQPMQQQPMQPQPTMPWGPSAAPRAPEGAQF